MTSCARQWPFQMGTGSVEASSSRRVAHQLRVTRRFRPLRSQFKPSAGVDLTGWSCRPDARQAPETSSWRLQRHGGAGETSARPPFAAARARAPRAALHGAHPGPGRPDLSRPGRGPAARMWRPRRVRSVKHLSRHNVLSLLGGHWRQTRHAGGPTEGVLCVCPGGGCSKRSTSYVLTWQKGRICERRNRSQCCSTEHFGGF